MALPLRNYALAALMALPVAGLVRASAPGAPANGTAGLSVGAQWRGHGELAVGSGHDLRLIEDSGASHNVEGPGAPSQPAWSPDGKWVAYLRTPSTAGPSADATLWVARANGTGARRVSSATADVEQFAWDPAVPESLAFSAYRPNGRSRLLVASPVSRVARTFATFANLIGWSWSPKGANFALSYRSGPPGKGEGVLEIAPTDHKAPRVAYRLPDYGYVDIESWWPDGKGLLFWDDPAGSASIAADGLSLKSLSLSTGKAKALATTLVYDNWVSWSPSGTTVAIVAGGNRMIWGSGKHLDLCAMPAGTCHRLALPPGPLMSMDPAWTAQGALLYVLAPGTTSANAVYPGMPKGAPYSAKNVDDWYNDQKLVVSDPPGSAGQILSYVDIGGHDPVVAGRAVLCVRRGDLWYLPSGEDSPFAVASHLADPSPYGNYYGYIAWYEDFAWHR